MITINAISCLLGSCVLCVSTTEEYSQTCVQGPLLGPEKCGRYAGGLYEKDQWKVGFRLVLMASDWPLFKGGRFSVVVVRTGLTVLSNNWLLLSFS